MSRKTAEDAAEAWLRLKDPEYSAPKLDTQDLATRGWSEESGRRRAPRPEHVPSGFAAVANGWLVPQDPQNHKDVFVAATVFRRAGLDKTERGPMLRRMQGLAARAVVEEGMCEKPGRWWRAPMAMLLQVEACTPTRHRMTAKQVSENLAAIWVGLGPMAPPLPELWPPLIKVAGDRLQRLTPAQRGGGRGPSARVSVDRAVDRIARAVAEQEKLATAKARVLQLLQERPEMSLRDVSASGGDPRTIRRAVALLLRDGALGERERDA